MHNEKKEERHVYAGSHCFATNRYEKKKGKKKKKQTKETNLSITADILALEPLIYVNLPNISIAGRTRCFPSLLIAIPHPTPDTRGATQLTCPQSS